MFWNTSGHVQLLLLETPILLAPDDLPVEIQCELTSIQKSILPELVAVNIVSLEV
jgi:hypothetical protein